MVEHQPSKLDTWVRFPSPALMVKVMKKLIHLREWLSGGAPPCQGGGRGFDSRLALSITIRDFAYVKISHIAFLGSVTHGIVYHFFYVI